MFGHGTRLQDQSIRRPKSSEVSRQTLHGDYGLPTGVNSSHLQRSLSGFGTGVPKKERVQRWVWHDGEQFLDEAEVGLMVRNAALIYARGNVRPAVRGGIKYRVTIPGNERVSNTDLQRPC